LIDADKIDRTQRFSGQAVDKGVVFTAWGETMDCTGVDIRNQQMT
jgi:hypothetical protein